MSVAKMAQVIGKMGKCRVELGRGSVVTLDVKVLDVRSAFGNVRYLVTPAAGEGQAWVASERVTVDA